jgi:DNA-directed RNA polymerase subunit delta
VSFDQLTQEELHEMSLIEITYQMLSEGKQPIAFIDLVDKITDLIGSTRSDVKDNISQFYTDLNIDGRFLNVGGNTWGLKGWYSVEQAEDDIVPTVKTKKKKVKLLDEDLDDYIDLDDEDLEYEDDLDDFDEIDDDEEEVEDLEEVDDLVEVDEFGDDIVEEEDDIKLDEEFEDDELEDEELDEV